MNLNFENNFFEVLKGNTAMKDLINELSNYLNANDEPIIEQILSKRGVSTGNENSIRWKEKETVLNYFNKMEQNGPIYFVKDNKKPYWKNNQRYINNDVFLVWKIENGKIEKIEINKKDIPQNIKTNDVFKIENGKYIIDDKATKELQADIINMANEILDKQDAKLSSFRKEGHLYAITDNQNGKIFMRDLTENSNIEFEEVNLSKELLDKVSQGTVLKYNNGIYECLKND